MTDTKNNLNALLARLKKKEVKREETKSPSIHPQEQSAFNDDNNISNILKQDNNKIDDSSFNLDKQKSTQNDFYQNHAPSFRPNDNKDLRNEVKERLENLEKEKLETERIYKERICNEWIPKIIKNFNERSELDRHNVNIYFENYDQVRILSGELNILLEPHNYVVKINTNNYSYNLIIMKKTD